MISPGQVQTQDLSLVKRNMSHYATVARASQVRKYWRCRWRISKANAVIGENQFRQPKKTLVRNFEHVFELHMFSVLPLLMHKEIENKFLVFGPIKNVLRI